MKLTEPELTAYTNGGMMGKGPVYNAGGIPELRGIRRPNFDLILQSGLEIDGKSYTLNQHVYNRLFKSGRKDIMPADITEALRSTPIPVNENSIKFVNPITGTRVYVNPKTMDIVGVQPRKFIE